MNTTSLLWLQKKKQLDSAALYYLEDDDAAHLRHLRQLAFPPSCSEDSRFRPVAHPENVGGPYGSSPSILANLLAEARIIQRTRGERKCAALPRAPVSEYRSRSARHSAKEEGAAQRRKNEELKIQERTDELRREAGLCVVAEDLQRSDITEEELNARCVLLLAHTQGILRVAQRSTCVSRELKDKEDVEMSSSAPLEPLPEATVCKVRVSSFLRDDSLWRHHLESLTF